MDSLTSILFRLVQLTKASLPIVFTLLGIVTFARLVQPSKAHFSMEVTLLIVTLARLVQPTKVLFRIVCTPFGIVTLARLVQ